mgnify:CR=1 FL=1
MINPFATPSPSASGQRAALAVLYTADAYANGGRKMGRQQAGLGLLPALIDATTTNRFPVVALRQEDLGPLRQQVQQRRPDLRLHLWPLDKLDRLSGVDGLFVADPSLVRWAELRQWHPRGSGAWSLIGLTHTLSSLGALEALRRIPAAPLQPWDALICTSRCARAAVQAVLQQEAETLARRFGGQAQAWAAPQLPVIPLGCDVARLSGLAKGRDPARAALRIPEEQVVLLFVGRLELHAKAHPGVLLQALARVAERLAQARPACPRPCLLVLGTARSQVTAQAWQQAVSHFSRWFELRLLDGHDPLLSDQAWAAGDVFVSLADSLQETFGLTPVEAMARGLPVIASDWNGYRDTVVHGVTGLLIPSSQPDPAAPHRLAELSLGRLRYDTFMADLMQQVVIAEEPLVEALERLLTDPELRVRMGEAGRQRASQHYDWSQVVAQIHALTLELAERRQAASAAVDSPPLSPWRQFASWPSRHHASHGLLRIDPQRLRQRRVAMEQLQIYANLSTAAEPALQLLALQPLLSHLEALAVDQHQPFQLPLEALVNALPGQSPSDLQQALAWLAKIGALELPS